MSISFTRTPEANQASEDGRKMIAQLRATLDEKHEAALAIIDDNRKLQDVRDELIEALDTVLKQRGSDERIATENRQSARALLARLAPKGTP